MKEQMEDRLKQLKEEFETGQKMLTELESKQNNLRNTLLRISGAIQVLEEQLGYEPQTQSGGNGHHEKAEEIVTHNLSES